MARHKYLAVVDSKEAGLATLIIKGDDRPFTVAAKYLPGVEEGDIVEVSFKVKKDRRQQEKDEISSLIEGLQNK